MNDKPTKTKSCKKCKVELVQAYCPQCYPLPRVYCHGCGQPLTSPKHRARGWGARCWKKEGNRQAARRNARLRREVEFVEFIGKKKYRELGDLF